ncbi:hypothetical protein AK812_SmicGene44174, partial [Symbiodinium microadriaticum]
MSSFRHAAGAPFVERTLLRHARNFPCHAPKLHVIVGKKKIDRLDGLILIGRGLAKRLDLLREGGHFYAGAQCRGFLPCVKGMLMISKRLGDLDICVTERSAKMQVPMNTLKQDDGTAGSLPCVPAQNIDFKIAFEDDESTEMEVPLQKGHVAHDKLQLKWNGQSGSVFAYCGEDFTGPDSSLHRQDEEKWEQISNALPVVLKQCPRPPDLPDAEGKLLPPS